jgi:hypothetical protein
MERRDRGSRAPRRAESDETGAASMDYLQLTGYLCLAWCWAWMACVSACGAEGPARKRRLSIARSWRRHASTSSASCRARKRTSTRWARARAR